MKYIFSRFTRVIPYEDTEILIIYNSFNGNQSYVYSSEIKKQIELLLQGPVEEDQLDEAVKQKYCIIEGTDEVALVSNGIRKRINNDNHLNIIIIPTTDCNFRCVYCYEQKESGFISDETLNKLFDSISLYFSKINGKKSLRLDWFGGEPMLFFNKMVDYCIRINKYCVEHEILFQHSMTTNGYLLTKDKAAKLIECGINLYQITIDGTSNTHDKYRQLKNGSPTWQTIVNNLIDLKNIADDFKVQIRINYNLEIAESVDEFFEFFERTFGGDKRFELTFHAIGHWGGDNDSKVSVVSPEYQSYMMHELAKTGLSRGITQFVSYVPSCGAELCYANMRRSYVIYKNGLIGKCTLEESPDKDSAFVIGDINDGYFRIDAEKEKKWIHTEIDYINHVETNKCGECISFPICGGTSCPAYRIKNGKYAKKCTPTMYCIDDLIKLNYEMMVEGNNQ